MQNRGMLLAAAAASALAGSMHAASDATLNFAELMRNPFDSYGEDHILLGRRGRLMRGSTQGSSKDTLHQRHLNRLARKARRQERLHRHTATGHRLLASASA